MTEIVCFQMYSAASFSCSMAAVACCCSNGSSSAQEANGARQASHVGFDLKCVSRQAQEAETADYACNMKKTTCGGSTFDADGMKRVPVQCWTTDM